MEKNRVIAVIDDYASNLDLLGFALADLAELHQFSVKKFLSANKFLEYLQSFVAQSDQVVLAYLDINMPEMDGFELLVILKRDYPQIKVIMQTAYSDAAHIKRATDLGADGYLTKPVNISRLRELSIEILTSA